MLLVGIVLLAVGYSGGLGSPLAHQVQLFLDAAGTPLRNVHKLEPVIRLPLVLGLAHLLGRIPLPGSAPRKEWMHAFAHPEHDKRVAVGIVVLVALAAGSSLAWTGRLTPPGAFDAIPPYWHQTADWLDEHNAGSPAGRVLVVPGAPFATQVWGTSHDEPLQVLGNSPWGVRDSIPLTPPQTIRALDSVQRLLAAGRPSAGLADTLARQGISYVVVRNDLDPQSSRSARPVLVHRAIEGSGGLVKVAQFGEQVGPGTLAGFITDSGLRPKYPAVEIYRVDSGAAPPGAPYLTDTDAMARIDGGPEALLRLDERRRLLSQPPLGPMLLTADAQRAGLPTPVVTVTDTPLARETDYGRVDDHSSAIRAEGDARHTFNRVPDYPAGDTRPVHGAWTGGRVTASSSAADSTALPNVAPATGPTAAIDSDSSTTWVSNALQSAVGQWLQVDFDHPVTNATITVTPSATAVGAQVRRIEISTVNGTSTLRFDEPGQADHRGAAVRRNTVGPDHRGRHRRRVARRAVRHHRFRRHPVRRLRLRAPDRATAHRDGARSAGGFRCRTVGSGFGATGSARLRRGPRRRALCGGDGVVPGGAGQSQPNPDRPRTDFGHADGVGAAKAGTQPRRSRQPAGNHPRLRGLRPDRRARLHLRGHRRGPAHRVDRAAACSAVPHAAHPDAETARPRRGGGAAADTEFVDAARTPQAGGDRPRRRTAGAPTCRRRRSADGGPATPNHRHGQGVAPGLGRRHRPHRTGFRPAQAAGPGRDRCAGRGRAGRSRPPTRRATARGRSRCPVAAARSSPSRASSCRRRSTPPSARC